MVYPPVVAFPSSNGVSKTSQVSPLSGEKYTREVIPPDKIQVLSPLIAILELLAAKAASPSITSGKRSQLNFFQVLPPSRVMIMDIQLLVGSPIAIPSL